MCDCNWTYKMKVDGRKENVRRKRKAMERKREKKEGIEQLRLLG